MKKIPYIFVLCVVSLVFISCKTTINEPTDPVIEANNKFLSEGQANRDEVFRVLLMSDTYQCVQVGAKETIARGADPSGDAFVCDELSRYDKINEVRDAIITVSLFPDTGRIMKVRPKRLSALMEIDELIVEDIQRWTFTSPRKREVSPLRFDIHYRIVLRKKQSDEEIIKEVQEKLKEKN